MLKRLTIASVILVATTHFACADTVGHVHRKVTYKGETINYAPPPISAPLPQSAHFAWGGGPYLGLNLGVRTNYTSNPVAYKGLEGTLTAGFGVLMKSGFYIGEEVFAADGVQLQNYSDSAEGGKSSWSIGLSVLPGYLILDNLIGYLRLGVVKTYFSSNGSYNGGQVGLGLEAALSENWDLRSEYIYSFYGTESSCSSEPGELGSVKSDQFNVGLIYKFM